MRTGSTTNTIKQNTVPSQIWVEEVGDRFQFFFFACCEPFHAFPKLGLRLGFPSPQASHNFQCELSATLHVTYRESLLQSLPGVSSSPLPQLAANHKGSVYFSFFYFLFCSNVFLLKQQVDEHIRMPPVGTASEPPTDIRVSIAVKGVFQRSFSVQ